jgi:hypothetical protein
VLGIEFVEAVLVNEPTERRGAPGLVDAFRIGLPHRRRLPLRLRHLGCHDGLIV